MNCQQTNTAWYDMQMTLIALPAMKDHKKGVIVNIGSAAGSVVPASPLTSVYAGTKVSTHGLLCKLTHWQQPFQHLLMCRCM